MQATELWRVDVLRHFRLKLYFDTIYPNVLPSVPPTYLFDLVPNSIAWILVEG